MAAGPPRDDASRHAAGTWSVTHCRTRSATSSSGVLPSTGRRAAAAELAGSVFDACFITAKGLYRLSTGRTPPGRPRGAGSGVALRPEHGPAGPLADAVEREHGDEHDGGRDEHEVRVGLQLALTVGDH